MRVNELEIEGPLYTRRREPLVILPGLLCDSRMFGNQVEALSAQVVDGFYDGADRIEAMARYVIERLPDRCALLGHSMGARIAIEVWRIAPERVARLALADTGVHAVRDGEMDKRYQLRDLGRSAGDAALVDAWLPPMIGSARRGDRTLLASLRAMAVDAGLVTYSAQIEALLSRPDAEAVLQTIDCPTFVIVGSDDQWSPVDQHRLIAAAVPGSQLRLVEGAGHMAPAEDPVRFNEILREWLSWPSRSDNVSGSMGR